MKTTTCFLILLACFSVPLTVTLAQWNWQSPLPQGNTLLHIQFIDGSLGWATGECGTVIHTTDGGASWYEQEYGRTDNILDLCMVSDLVGWAAGDNGVILTTTDGGDDWLEQASGVTSGLNAIVFLDSLNGWAAGDNEVILHTTNGGTSWSLQHQVIGQNDINSMTFLNGLNGWAAGGGGKLFHTTSGGASWVSQTVGPSSAAYLAISFVDTSLGFAVGTHSAIVRTENGGATWSTITTGDTVNYNQVLMQNFFVGWIVGDGGRLLRTLNGGLSWSSTAIGDGADINGLSRRGSTQWVSCESGKILRSTNSGTSWSELDSGSRLSANWVDFPSSSVGVAVGQTGLILRTTDAGSHWTASSSPTPSISCYGVKCTDETHGWAVGDNGTILRTTDGNSWQQQACPVSTTLFGVAFAGPSDGWIVGADYGGPTSAVLHSSDNGNSWSVQLGGIPGILYGLSFADPMTGWAVGSGGMILHTTNGGGAWNPQTSGTAATLYWCTFSDPHTGWAVGDSGRVLRTTDGGNSWQQQPSGTAVSLYSITSSGASEATAAGELGTILHTTDGGTHWGLQYSRTTYGLFGVSEAPSGDTWIAGDYGTLLKESAQPVTGTVTGVVFNDINNNGTRDAGEPGMSGWLVSLGGAQSTSIFSGTNGEFTFSDLPLGSYTLQVTIQRGWSQTSPTPQGSYSFGLNRGQSTFAGNFGNHSASACYYSIDDKWNTISLPVVVPDGKVMTLFPSAVSQAFWYATSYVAIDSLHHGTGYWLKFPFAQNAWIAGAPVLNDTISLRSGWNLIGSIADTVATGSVITHPPGVIISSYFGFHEAYQPSTVIAPGKAYWIKASQPATLFLTAPAQGAARATSVQPEDDLARLNTLAITDGLGRSTTLFFGERGSSSPDLARSELPPLPPPECFDARFETGRWLALFPPSANGEERAGISLQDAQPTVTLAWNIREQGTLFYELVTPSGSRTLSGTGSALLEMAGAKALVLMAVPDGKGHLPSEYALLQNTPNPFNPTTSIPFTLPVRSRVRLEIFTLLGQAVAVLEDGELEAGYHSAFWAPSSNASGLYIYRLEASPATGSGSGYVQTRKMLLLR
jgi:photosystem II stability/assembly factor-like uncharacterized protein